MAAMAISLLWPIWQYGHSGLYALILGNAAPGSDFVHKFYINENLKIQSEKKFFLNSENPMYILVKNIALKLRHR